MTVNELKKWGIEQLCRGVSSSAKPTADTSHTSSPAQIDVTVLLQEALGLTKEQLIISRDVVATPEQTAKFKSFIERRAKSEPIAYILGKKDFYNHTFIVDESVLIPRPETEHIVELALEYFDENTRDFYVADICTGSGAIILSIVDELKSRFGEQYLTRGEFEAVDISDSALEIAKKNAALLGLTSRVNFYKSDLCAGINIQNRTLILFVANPPYIMEGAPLQAEIEQFEPGIALWGGADGFEIIRRLLHELAPSLQRGAKLIMEIGEGQEPGVREILRECGIAPQPRVETQDLASRRAPARFIQDYAGKVRIVMVG